MQASPRHRFDYLAVGHVTRDVKPAEGRGAVGGAAFYSALQAARLGLRTGILTAGDPVEIRELIEPWAGEVELEIQPAEDTTTFEVQGIGPGRELRMVRRAASIEPPARWSAGIVHLAPVAFETPPAPIPGADFVGLSAQGLLRRREPGGELSLLPIEPASLPACDAMVLSESEQRAAASAIRTVLASGGTVAITAGSDGAVARTAEREVRHEALERVDPVDDLGAGDVFAAAFFVALHAGLPLADALDRGQAAGLVRVSGRGPDAVGEVEAIEARLPG